MRYHLLKLFLFCVFKCNALYCSICTLWRETWRLSGLICAGIRFTASNQMRKVRASEFTAASMILRAAVRRAKKIFAIALLKRSKKVVIIKQFVDFLLIIQKTSEKVPLVFWKDWSSEEEALFWIGSSDFHLLVTRVHSLFLYVD